MFGAPKNLGALGYCSCNRFLMSGQKKATSVHFYLNMAYQKFFKALSIIKRNIFIDIAVIFFRCCFKDLSLVLSFKIQHQDLKFSLASH